MAAAGRNTVDPSVKPDEEISRLLSIWSKGDQSALNSLLPLVIAQMRNIARRMRKRNAGSTLNTTALVNETYIRFAGAACDAHDREHFLALTARAMRQILLDYAKARHRQKRGAGAISVELSETHLPTDPQIEYLLTIEEHLNSLEREHARRCHVFEMRFFGGFSVEEIAHQCGTSENTVIRDYRFACAWLRLQTSRVPALK